MDLSDLEAALDEVDASGDPSRSEEENEELELEFDRAHDSLQGAITSAIQDVERAGFPVRSIEMDRDAVLPAGAK